MRLQDDFNTSRKTVAFIARKMANRKLVVVK
jgi:hypothetical protein